MKNRPIPENRETFTALEADTDGHLTCLAATPLSEKPGFDGYLIPWYVLSDRGTFFVPGSAKRTANARKAIAPHLWQHDTWEPLGKHAAALEDDKGFRIAVELNLEIQRAAEVYSNLKFGTPLGMSVGFDRIADRSGTDADDAKLDRSTAPDYLKNIPINELRAITEFRWWESSTVTFAGIATAKPDTVHSQNASADELEQLLTALKAGTATAEQVALAQQIAEAHAKSPAPAQKHGTDELEQERIARRNRLALTLAQQADYLVREEISV